MIPPPLTSTHIPVTPGCQPLLLRFRPACKESKHRAGLRGVETETRNARTQSLRYVDEAEHNAKPGVYDVRAEAGGGYGRARCDALTRAPPNLCTFAPKFCCAAPCISVHTCSHTSKPLIWSTARLANKHSKERSKTSHHGTCAGAIARVPYSSARGARVHTHTCACTRMRAQVYPHECTSSIQQYKSVPSCSLTRPSPVKVWL